MHAPVIRLPSDPTTSLCTKPYELTLTRNQQKWKNRVKTRTVVRSRPHYCLFYSVLRDWPRPSF